ncbi:helix-loop-helix DNA-binding domain-containing protein [Mycotypha africana]|uniref:helix-loop-helix DNA-binding domain-containing protein n=1 Tax=Mycotypha africana TaxID=64632 RepID=UPI002300B73C|nr:helix-loop-helix DNA-binding domain-containing protein [Mycotypha africana]KAI8973191.1 helix-loop-helix DNA-binding domain-containing protein [Mycotypha africana]
MYNNLDQQQNQLIAANCRNGVINSSSNMQFSSSSPQHMRSSSFPSTFSIQQYQSIPIHPSSNSSFHNVPVYQFNSNSPTAATQWFGTSLDSSSSFGQSPVFTGQELQVTPSNSSQLFDEIAMNNNEEDEVTQRNHQEIYERRRKRRESHNAVERRRRDNINERIQELSTLLPDHLLESVPASANVITLTTGQSGTNGKPINKGTILKLSVTYIKELREEVVMSKSRIDELQQLIENAERSKGSNPTVRANNNRSKESSGSLLNLGSSMQFQQQFGRLHIAAGDE